MGFIIRRPPVTPEELWQLVVTMWGVRIPRTRVCPGHSAPFDAFCEGYFGNDANWALWYGSRGTGKSLMLAILGITRTVVLDTNTILLGGSMAQSQNVHEHIERLMRSDNAPVASVARQIKTELLFQRGNWVRPIPASQTTARGPHPHTTLLDEIDEMEKAIYDAAQGQALRQPNMLGLEVPEMTVASSTWQNPIGTFQEVRDHALLEGLPIHTWCWREVVKTPENPDGWMDPAFIENKRRSVGREMFRVEYELGEPRGGSRALDPDLVEKFFVDMVPVRESHRANDDEWVYAEPEVNGTYVAGADWAKETDKTSITVFRTDLDPAPLVYQRTLNRRSWPEMVKLFNATVTRYHAMSGHDATGVGNVVNDMVDSRVLKVLMVDQKRRDLLNEYVSDFESGRYRLPRGTPIHNMHKATTMAMVWAGAAGAGAHLPDEFASAAIANRARRRMPPPVGGSDVPKGSNPVPARSLRPVSTSPSMRPMGDVVQYEDDEDIAVFSFG